MVNLIGSLYYLPKSAHLFRHCSEKALTLWILWGRRGVSRQRNRCFLAIQVRSLSLGPVFPLTLCSDAFHILDCLHPFIMQRVLKIPDSIVQSFILRAKIPKPDHIFFLETVQPPNIIPQACFLEKKNLLDLVGQIFPFLVFKFHSCFRVAGFHLQRTQNCSEMRIISFGQRM